MPENSATHVIHLLKHLSVVGFTWSTVQTKGRLFGSTQDNPATMFISSFARLDELNPGYDISGTSQLAIYGIYLTLNDWK
jgi:hypothetical protein